MTRRYVRGLTLSRTRPQPNLSARICACTSPTPSRRVRAFACTDHRGTPSQPAAESTTTAGGFRCRPKRVGLLGEIMSIWRGGYYDAAPAERDMHHSSAPTTRDRSLWRPHDGEVQLRTPPAPAHLTTRRATDCEPHGPGRIGTAIDASSPHHKVGISTRKVTPDKQVTVESFKHSTCTLLAQAAEYGKVARRYAVMVVEPQLHDPSRIVGGRCRIPKDPSTLQVGCFAGTPEHCSARRAR